MVDDKESQWNWSHSSPGGSSAHVELLENRTLLSVGSRFIQATGTLVISTDTSDDAMEQLWGGIGAVFQSWTGKRAIAYRRIEGIPEDWGTAVNVQAMVFGNMGESSAFDTARQGSMCAKRRSHKSAWIQCSRANTSQTTQQRSHTCPY